MLDELVGHLAMGVVEVVEVAGKRVSFELVLDRSCDEAAQASVPYVLLHPSSEILLDAHGPLADSHALILPR